GEKGESCQAAVPSWGVGTGGTRFARFPGRGEPRDIYQKLEDCGTIFKLVRSPTARSRPHTQDCGTILKLVRSTPAVSLHIPWDRPDDVTRLREFAGGRGLHFDATNSNTF